MIKSTPRGFWTFDRIIEDANKFHSYREWRLSGTGGHGAAIKKKLLEKIKKDVF